MDNDLRVLRDRQAAHQDAADAARAGGPPACDAAMLARTTADSSYPTTAQAVYAVIPCDVDAAEEEGESANYVPQSDALAYALNLGGQVPPEGTMVLCDAAGGRWCFRYDG